MFQFVRRTDVSFIGLCCCAAILFSSWFAIMHASYTLRSEAAVRGSSFHLNALVVAKQDSYALAKQQSYDFFTDIEDHHWKLMQKRVLENQPNMKCGENCNGMQHSGLNSHAWFQQNFEPEFSCLHERRIGEMGDGGKWVCDPHRLSQPNTSCLVYSVGSNGDFSFEKAISEKIGSHCEIHTFDMDNFAPIAQKANIPNHFYHQWGITNEDKVTRVDAVRFHTMKTLNSTLHTLGHVGKKIDIFKIDCEGCEFTTFETWFDQGAILQQILVEVHSKNRRNVVDPVQFPNFFKKMYQNGYAMFHKEANIQFWCAFAAVEFAFVKLHADFFNPNNTLTE